MSANAALPDHVKALTFDVFGTIVDWRSSVESVLRDTFRKKIASPQFSSLSADLQARVRAVADTDVAKFAQEWRNAYSSFTKGFVPGTTPWKDVDAHHYDSLVEQLNRWQLAGLFADDEEGVRSLSLVWHRLTPWADSADGIRRLGARFVTATLSNGNQELLRDLADFGNLGFARIISAADFHAYKPHPSVYLGAADRLGVKPADIAMVAAHLNDLEAAKNAGLRTVYIERPGEEAWKKDEERYRAAKDWVDVWVGQGEDGVREVAARLGL
ncbi:haloacid dehalogenase [Niveomyces insectorum RCEF 264]|uniref:Haloacid dehalogenase n=1 Tax=Niveomyces insectorum RCEF 264 TaxID=1081102 RepID=A0A167X9J2_9HYPO|nr:haloacid dehalogenase [Niveomyces insectorum RCEF 264]